MRQALGSPLSWENTPLYFRLTKGSRLRCQAQIAGQSQLQSTAKTMSVYCRNHRLEHIGHAHRRYNIIKPAGCVRILAGGIPLLDIASYAEGFVSGAGDDHYQKPGVVFEIAPDFGQLGDRLPIKGIHHLGTVKCDEGYSVFLFIEQIHLFSRYFNMR